MQSTRSVVVMLLASAVSINASVISGVVKDSASGSALPDIAIALKKTTAQGTTVARDTTDTVGSFSVTWDSAGTYVVRSTDPLGTHAQRFDTVKITDPAAPVTLTILMSAVQFSSLAGTITDSATTAPITGAIVTLRTGSGGGPGASRRDTTGTDGKYSFDSIATGSYTASASASGYADKSSSVAIAGTAPQTLDFALVPIVYGSLSGTITDSATTAPITGAIVTLRTGSGGGSGASRRDTTGTDGKYSFDSVAADTYTVSVSASGYERKSSSVAIAGTAPQTLDFALVPLVYFSVSGTITDSASGAKIADAVVLLRSSSGTTLDSVVTDSAGAYALDSATNEYSLRVRADGFRTKTVTLSAIASAEPQKIDISLTAASGTVQPYSMRAAERPAWSYSNGCLHLRNLPDAGIVRIFNAQGRLVCMRSFSAAGPIVDLPLENRVSPGSYIVTISRKGGAFLKSMLVAVPE